MNLPCDYPFTHFEVNHPNGDVTCCCQQTRVLGNINRQSATEIWNGEGYRDMRRRFLAGDILSVCPGECPVLHGWKQNERLDWYRTRPMSSPVRRNAERNEQEQADGALQLVSQPRWLRYAASYRCNLRCYHCFQAQDRTAQAELPDSFFAQARAWLPALQMVFLYGGEPLLEPRNLALVEEIAAQGEVEVRLSLITNAAVLSEAWRSALARVRPGIVSMSLDTCDPALFAELHPPARWDTVLANARFLAGWARARGETACFGFTMNRRNCGELPAFVDFCAAEGALATFQLAHNVFRDARFARTYALHTRGDFRRLLPLLQAAQARARAHGMHETERNLAEFITQAEKRSRWQPLLALRRRWHRWRRQRAAIRAEEGDR